MKRFILLLVVLLCETRTHTLHAQTSDSTYVVPATDTTLTVRTWLTKHWVVPETSKLERVSYVVGSSLAFSLLDYVGFNYIAYNLHESPIATQAFRTLQVLAQLGFSYFLYEQCGLSSTVSFNLIWWTWGDDLGFYGWSNLINAGAPWENRIHSGLRGETISWASWTPLGIVQPRTPSLSRNALVAQGILGFSIAVVIN